MVLSLLSTNSIPEGLFITQTHGAPPSSGQAQTRFGFLSKDIIWTLWLIYRLKLTQETSYRIWCLPNINFILLVYVLTVVFSGGGGRGKHVSE